MSGPQTETMSVTLWKLARKPETVLAPLSEQEDTPYNRGRRHHLSFIIAAIRTGTPMPCDRAGDCPLATDCPRVDHANGGWLDTACGWVDPEANYPDPQQEGEGE